MLLIQRTNPPNNHFSNNNNNNDCNNKCSVCNAWICNLFWTRMSFVSFPLHFLLLILLCLPRQKSMHTFPKELWIHACITCMFRRKKSHYSLQHLYCKPELPDVNFKKSGKQLENLVSFLGNVWRNRAILFCHIVFVQLLIMITLRTYLDISNFYLWITKTVTNFDKMNNPINSFFKQTVSSLTEN